MERADDGSRPGPALVVVGFDAADRDRLDDLLAAGRLPVLAGLGAAGVTADLENPFGMLSGPVWPTIATGCSPARHGAWSWRMLVPGTYRLEWRGPNGEVAADPFWVALDRAGLRTLVVDLPNVGLQAPRRGVQVIGWGQHDRYGSFATAPAALADEIRVRFPRDGHDRCDERGVAGDHDRLRAELLAGLDQKVELVAWLADRARPDVVTVVFGETHCAGHQFWPGSGVDEVYEAADRALGRLLRALGGDPMVIVVASHGIGPAHHVAELNDRVLRALDARLGSAPWWMHAREFARRAPNRAARLARRAARRPIDDLAHYVDGSRRFFPVPNFPAFGAIRVNLAGREPAGRVTPAELPAVLDFLHRELLALRDADAGAPAVVAVVPTADVFRVGPDVGLPELLVQWNPDTPLDGVTSPTIGTIRHSFRESRAGGHRRDGRVVCAGPGIAPTDGRATMRGEDVAPTIAALLGVPVAGLDGIPLPGVTECAGS